MAARRFTFFYPLTSTFHPTSSPLDLSGTPTLFDASLLTPEPPFEAALFSRTTRMACNMRVDNLEFWLAVIILGDLV